MHRTELHSPPARTLVADPSPATRSWLAASLGATGHRATEVAAGWEVLWHLAEEPVELVVASGALPDVPAHQVLAMVRGAGVGVPFLLILPFSSGAARAVVSRARNAEIVEDWLDANELRAARGRLLAQPAAPRRRGASRVLTRAAGAAMRHSEASKWRV